MLILSADSACDICLDPYAVDGAKAPSSLACGHSFCRSCLYTLGTRICPVCRQPFSVVNDMRKIHVDFESKITRDVTKYELRALETCRSGDVQQMQDGVAEIEEWLSTQAPGFRSGLQTAIELVRLLMEATGQLHTALDRNEHEETRSRQRKELDEMKWTVEKRRMVQENEALQEGLSRQRERLAYLESELAKARGDGQGQGQTTQQHHPISMTTSADPSRTRANTTDGHASSNDNIARNGNGCSSMSTGHGQDTPMHTRTPPRTPTRIKAPEPTLNTSITSPRPPSTSGNISSKGGILASPRQSSGIPVSERQTANTTTTLMSSSFPSPVSPPPHQLTQTVRSPPSSIPTSSFSSARAAAAVTSPTGRSSSTKPTLSLPLPPPLTFDTSFSSSTSSHSHHAYTHSAPSAVTTSTSRPTTPSKANIRATRGIGSGTSTPTPLGDANMNIKPTATTGVAYGESLSRRGSTTQRLRASLHGPRDRSSGTFESFNANGGAGRGVTSGDVRPPGAAPSAFSSAMRGMATPTTYDPSRHMSASPPPSSAKRTSLPATSPSSFLSPFRQQPAEEQGDQGTETLAKQEPNKLRGHNRRSLQNTGTTSSWVLVDSPPAVQSTQSDYFPSTSSRPGQANRSGSGNSPNSIGMAWHQQPSMNEISMSDQSSMSLLKTVDDSFDSFSLLNSVTSTFDHHPTTATYISPISSIPSLSSSSMSGRAMAAGFSVPPRPARSHPPNITPTSSMPNTPIAEGTTGRGVEQLATTLATSTTPILSSPPPSATVSSLSRKRALRRNTKEYNVEGLGV